MKMHWLTGKVNLSGQGFTIIHFGAHEPISWPEAMVLMALHGEENVYDLAPCAISDTTARDEKHRLLVKYERIVEQVYPGVVPRMDLLMPGESEDQPHADNEGKVIAKNGNGPGPDDDDDDGGDGIGLDPPTGPAVFKPGKHQPPMGG